MYLMFTWGKQVKDWRWYYYTFGACTVGRLADLLTIQSRSKDKTFKKISISWHCPFNILPPIPNFPKFFLLPQLRSLLSRRSCLTCLATVRWAASTSCGCVCSAGWGTSAWIRALPPGSSLSFNARAVVWVDRDLNYLSVSGFRIRDRWFCSNLCKSCWSHITCAGTLIIYFSFLNLHSFRVAY